VIDAQTLERLCREWISRASDYEDEAPSDAGEAVEVAIDGPGYKADGLFDGPLGQGFRAGLDFGIHVAVAVAGDSVQDPVAYVKSALEHATRRMRELRAAQGEEIEDQLQKLDHRATETESPVKDNLRDRRERTSSRPAKKVI